MGSLGGRWILFYGAEECFCFVDYCRLVLSRCFDSFMRLSALHCILQCLLYSIWGDAMSRAQGDDEYHIWLSGLPFGRGERERRSDRSIVSHVHGQRTRPLAFAVIIFRICFDSTWSSVPSQWAFAIGMVEHVERRRSTWWTT